METMCQSASMCLLALRATNASTFRRCRVYFWMAMQMMKGIMIILVINHYVTFLGECPLFGMLRKGSSVGALVRYEQTMGACAEDLPVYIYIYVYNIINIYTYDTWCILSWIISMCPVPPRYKLVYRPHEHPCASSLQFIAHISV